MERQEVQQLLEVVEFRPFILKLSRDMRKTAGDIPRKQARILVDTYYTLQDARKALGMQIYFEAYRWDLARLTDDRDAVELLYLNEEKELTADAWDACQSNPEGDGVVRREAKRYAKSTMEGVPSVAVSDFLVQLYHLTHSMEDFAGRGLAEIAPRTIGGQWLAGLYGIGPVLSAALLAFLDVTTAPHMSSWRKLGGIAPHVTWEKGQKRPWNARLKTLLWKVGDSFVKFHRSPKSEVYGEVYANWKRIYVERDANEFYREKALHEAETRQFRDQATKATYASGHYPLGRLDLMARRKAVSMFLGHLYEVLYYEAYGRHCGSDYVQAYLGHQSRVACPHWPWPDDPPHYGVLGNEQVAPQ